MEPNETGQTDPSVFSTPNSLQTEATAPKGRPYTEWAGKPLTPAECEKVNDILAACEDPVDWDALTRLATSIGGLLDDEVRQVAWPRLLGYKAQSNAESEHAHKWHELPRHKDENQVELDVNRSFIYYPKNESEDQLDRRKNELSAVITHVLRENPDLCYFQGFHDIVQVFLLVLGVRHAADAVNHLSLLRIRDFMLPSMNPSLAHLRLIPSILYSVDPRLCRHLSQTQPFFALAATLTLYAHDIQEYGDISRLFDFLLAHGAVVSVYFFAVIVLSRREELFEIPAEEPEMLHSILSKLPKPLDLEALISRTMTLLEDHPPERLPFRAWSRISPFSVLKTTREPIRKQSLEDGHNLLVQQMLQLRREELRERGMALIWNYRRSAGSFGLTVLIGILSFYLRRSGWNWFPLLGLRKIGEHFGLLRSR